MGRGQACLARLGGAWLDVRVTAVHPGGTVSVVEAGRETAFMADWHSVSACDLAVDDAARWTALVAPHLAADGTLGVEDVVALLAGVGTTTTAEGLAAWWGEGAAGPGRRTAEDVHRLLRGAGWCAKQLDPRVPRDPWFRLWWNQVRMGGRPPEEVAPVGPSEARAALGLEAAPIDAAVAGAVARWSAGEGFPLPVEVVELVSLAGYPDAFRDAHCNNPEWQPVEDWEVLTDLRDAGVDADRGVLVALPHQGDHAWALTPDGRVWMRHPRGEDAFGYLPVAPSLAFFVWDLVGSRADWERGTAAPGLEPEDA